ncbi:MAG: DUF192 domain-containing protein [Pseudomonadota bacterium]|nr:DUF192 domain-containing protein [Pseudomonadota bacterium]
MHDGHLVDLQNRVPAAFMNSETVLRRQATPMIVLLAAALLQACRTGVAAPQEGLPTIEACFLTGTAAVPVTLEVASTPEERRKGLMGRAALPQNRGMLFEYQQERDADHGFWMYKTRIPLDIAYLDETGTIGSIRHMVPCASASGSGCPTYPAGVPFISAVEMNAGFFWDNGIGPGDRLRSGEADCPNP